MWYIEIIYYDYNLWFTAYDYDLWLMVVVLSVGGCGSGFADVVNKEEREDDKDDNDHDYS